MQRQDLVIATSLVYLSVRHGVGHQSSSEVQRSTTPKQHASEYTCPGDPFFGGRWCHRVYPDTRPYGTFQAPASRARPRFRYWLPDASVDPEIIKADIRDAGAHGAGGVEFLPFFNYGGSRGAPPGTDWSTYNFGTPPFHALFRAALEAHQENDLLMDFALGPNQGQGVPAAADDEGIQWDLVSC